MSNEISDTAIILAAKRMGTLQIAYVDFSYCCFEITIISNDEDQTITQVMYSDALAAQADIDAANNLNIRISEVRSEYSEYLCDPAPGIDLFKPYMSGTDAGEYLPLDWLREMLPEIFSTDHASEAALKAKTKGQ
jgi:hypothetical protein